MKLPGFKFLDLMEFDDLSLSVKSRSLKAKDCRYLAFEIDDILVLKWAGLDSEEYEDDDSYFLPGNVWQRIIFPPPVGLGTQLLNSDKLLLPIIVLNEKNEQHYKEVYNDGIVAFFIEQAGDKNKLLSWVKSCTTEEYFSQLGSAVLQQYVDLHGKGGVTEFLK